MTILTAGDDVLINRIFESLRRHRMTDLLERLARVPEIRAIAERASAEAAAEAAAQATAEANARVRAEKASAAAMIRVLLVDRFGEHGDLDEIAAHLAEGELAPVPHRIRDAGSLDDLRD